MYDLKKFSSKDMFIDLVERERGRGERDRVKQRERNMDVREKHRSVASRTCPDQGWNPQPMYVP